MHCTVNHSFSVWITGTIIQSINQQAHLLAHLKHTFTDVPPTYRHMQTDTSSVLTHTVHDVFMTNVLSFKVWQKFVPDSRSTDVETPRTVSLRIGYRFRYLFFTVSPVTAVVQKYSRLCFKENGCCPAENKLMWSSRCYADWCGLVRGCVKMACWLYTTCHKCHGPIEESEHQRVTDKVTWRCKPKNCRTITRGSYKMWKCKNAKNDNV